MDRKGVKKGAKRNKKAAGKKTRQMDERNKER
jgi:hypothetical protein